MRESTTLAKALLNSEFELAKALHDTMRGQGYSSVKTAAMIYRHGYLDGRDSQREKTNVAYKKLYELQKSTESTQPITLPQSANQEATEND